MDEVTPAVAAAAAIPAATPATPAAVPAEASTGPVAAEPQMPAMPVEARDSAQAQTPAEAAVQATSPREVESTIVDRTTVDTEVVEDTVVPEPESVENAIVVEPSNPTEAIEPVKGEPEEIEPVKSDRSDDIEHANHAPLANESQGNGKHPASEPRTAGLFDAESSSSPADAAVTGQHADESDTEARQRHDA